MAIIRTLNDKAFQPINSSDQGRYPKRIQDHIGLPPGIPQGINSVENRMAPHAKLIHRGLDPLDAFTFTLSMCRRGIRFQRKEFGISICYRDSPWFIRTEVFI